MTLMNRNWLQPEHHLREVFSACLPRCSLSNRGLTPQFIDTGAALKTVDLSRPAISSPSAVNEQLCTGDV